MEQEFEQATKFFYEIEDITWWNLGDHFEIRFDWLLANIYKMLDHSKVSDINVHLHCLGLKLLRKIIEVWNTWFFIPSSDWNTDDWI